MTNYGPGQPPPPPGQPPQGYPVPGQPVPGQPPPAYPQQPYPPAAAPQQQYPPAAAPPAGPPGAPATPGAPGYPGTVVGNPRPAGPTFQAPNPPGKVRGTFAVSVLSIITVGIYFLYWHAKVFQELRHRRERGPGGGIGFFTAGGIGFWLLPSTIADAYREGHREPPVTSQAGWWNLLPLIGFFVWIAKCNGALNRLWEGA